jgi:ABC-type glycerol-3-phosphate transport system substrate-binding protein
MTDPVPQRAAVRTRRRILVSSVWAAASGATLAACGGPPASGGPAAGAGSPPDGAGQSPARTGTLVVGNQITYPELDAIRARTVQAFRERYPGVRVEEVNAPLQEYNQKLC